MVADIHRAGGTQGDVAAGIGDMSGALPGALAATWASNLRLAEARKLAEQILSTNDELGPGGETELVQVSKVLAALAMVGVETHLGQFERAVSVAQAALLGARSTAVRAVVPWAASMVGSQLAFALVRAGRVEDAHHAVVQMKMSLAGTGRHEVVSAQLGRADVEDRRAVWQDPLDALELVNRNHRHVLSEADDPGDRLAAGFVSLLTGHPAAAETALREYLERLPEHDLLVVRCALALLAHSMALQGKPAEARLVLARASGAVTMAAFEHFMDSAVGAIAVAESRLEDAVEHVIRCGEAAFRRKLWMIAGKHFHEAARFGAAARVVERMRVVTTHCDGILAPCQLAHVEALADGDPSALEAVGARFEEIGMQLWAAESYAAAALGWQASGEIRAARMASIRGGQIWQKCDGAGGSWLFSAAESLTSMGVLTAREKEVVAFAAEGLSDWSIAKQLVVSVRTVEGHLANAYRKLGVTSRTQLRVFTGATQ
jgi:DNA-binding CsgD family transcriptional regulator